METRKSLEAGAKNIEKKSKKFGVTGYFGCSDVPGFSSCPRRLAMKPSTLMIVRDGGLGYPEQPFLTESSSVDHRTAHILASPRKTGTRSDRSERVGCEKSGKYTQYR